MSHQPSHAPVCHAQAEASPVSLVIEGHQKDLGGATVRRILPSAMRRMVGPFTFFDHFGPVMIPAGQRWDVRPHPHVHLATVTYFFEGRNVHRDSLGTVQEVRPRAINWMNAGHGIVHSERTPEDAVDQPRPMHGIQAWVALPNEHEDSEPSFQNAPADAIPRRERGAVTLRVIAGEAFGARSPIDVFSPLFYVEAIATDPGEVVLDRALGERAVYLVSGEARVDETPLAPNTMAIIADDTAPTLHLGRDAHAMLLGGQPIGKRFMEWNFVASDLARIERAKQRWRDDAFPRIESDSEERIPLPS